MNKFLTWLGFKKQEVTTFQMDVPGWDDSDAQELFSFFKTDSGNLFLKQMQKYQWEVNQWATDVSMENYDNMKYRACVAHGVKLCLDKMNQMQKQSPEMKHKKIDENNMNKFFEKRMSMFKS